MKRPGRLFLTLGTYFFAFAALACIWDSDTLKDETEGSPQLAEVILNRSARAVDSTALRARISELRAKPREQEPSWWNDLAGAYLRLGEPVEAIRLLESVVARFPNDYGMHANLGTAYHLTGRYVEAEKHIARDLEIDPDAHFGLERFHLALLQYLVRDESYQRRHVYIDEMSALLTNRWYPMSFSRFLSEDPLELGKRDEDFPEDDPPAYRFRWNLAQNPKLEQGTIYLASLNPEQPACFVILGLVCLTKPDADLHLALSAFTRAIELGSPQKEQLQSLISDIRKHINEARAHRRSGLVAIVIALTLFGLLIGGVLLLGRKLYRRFVAR